MQRHDPKRGQPFSAMQSYHALTDKDLSNTLSDNERLVLKKVSHRFDDWDKHQPEAIHQLRNERKVARKVAESTGPVQAEHEDSRRDASGFSPVRDVNPEQ